MNNLNILKVFDNKLVRILVIKTLTMNNKNFSFSEEEMNGIVEETYKNIINECKNLISKTNCPNEQIIALLSLVASTYTPVISKE